MRGYWVTNGVSDVVVIPAVGVVTPVDSAQVLVDFFASDPYFHNGWTGAALGATAATLAAEATLARRYGAIIGIRDDQEDDWLVLDDARALAGLRHWSMTYAAARLAAAA